MKVMAKCEDKCCVMVELQVASGGVSANQPAESSGPCEAATKVAISSRERNASLSASG